MQTLGDYPPALQAYVSESARATLPSHEIPTEGLSNDIIFLIRTSNRIRSEDSNGDSNELTIDDQTIGGEDREHNRSLYKSLGSSPIRITKTEKQIDEAMQRSIKEFDLVGAARGYRMLILKPHPSIPISKFRTLRRPSSTPISCASYEPRQPPRRPR